MFLCQQYLWFWILYLWFCATLNPFEKPWPPFWILLMSEPHSILPTFSLFELWNAHNWKNIAEIQITCPKVSWLNSTNTLHVGSSGMATRLMLGMRGATLKVVKCFDISASGICQKPLLASSCWRLMPLRTEPKFVHFGYWVHFMQDIFIKQFQVNINMNVPDRLSATTIPAHHFVGCDTLRSLPYPPFTLVPCRLNLREG